MINPFKTFAKKMSNEAQNKMKIEWQYPSEKYMLFQPHVKARHKCLYGGRGGGKDYTAAQTSIYIADQYRCRILYTREVQVSIQDSMHKIVKDLIIKKRLESRFEILEKSMRNKHTGSEFIFKGMQDIKSLEGIDIAIINEAQQVSEENAKRLIPTIRNEGSELWWLWNPENEEDWVNRYFLENHPPETIIHKVNYTDNIFCPQVLIDEASYLKDSDWEEYRHIWLGELKPKEKGWRFINPKWLDHAASGEIKPLDSPRIASRCAIGSDPAFYGIDEWVTITGKGNRVTEICAVKLDKSEMLADKKAGKTRSEIIAANLNSRVLAAGRFNCNIGVDGIGGGVGVCDILEGERYRLGDILNRCSSKDKDFVPPPPRGTECPSLSDFTNWKSQGWYQLRHDLEQNSIDLSEIAQKQPEEFRLLKKELIAHDMITTHTGKMSVKPKEEVKKELGWSPGRADALVAWNWVRKRIDDMPRAKSSYGYESKEDSADYMFV